jgi:hypothetical protein
VRVWVSVSACCGRPVAHVCTQVWAFGCPTGGAFRMQRTAAVLPKTRAGKLQGDRFHVLHG